MGNLLRVQISCAGYYLVNDQNYPNCYTGSIPGNIVKTVRYIGFINSDYEADDPNGMLEVYTDDIIRYTVAGEFTDGLIPTGYKVWPDGVYYYGELFGDEMHGQGTLYEADGSEIHTGLFLNGIIIQQNKI